MIDATLQDSIRRSGVVPVSGSVPSVGMEWMIVDNGMAICWDPIQRNGLWCTTWCGASLAVLKHICCQTHMLSNTVCCDCHRCRVPHSQLYIRAVYPFHIYDIYPFQGFIYLFYVSVSLISSCVLDPQFGIHYTSIYTCVMRPYDYTCVMLYI